MPLPEGLVFQPEFLNHEEERALLSLIQTLDLSSFKMHGVMSKRRIRHFGWKYSFESFRASEAEPIPAEFLNARARAASLARIAADEFAEALVTEYQPGAGIGWHRDAPPFGIVAGVSLAGRCRMRFQRGKGTARETAALELPPRSIYLLTGPARTEWEHTIPPTKELRYSLTFRTMRRRLRELSPLGGVHEESA